MLGCKDHARGCCGPTGLVEDARSTLLHVRPLRVARVLDLTDVERERMERGQDCDEENPGADGGREFNAMPDCLTGKQRSVGWNENMAIHRILLI
jgi:hypothetical protein